MALVKARDSAKKGLADLLQWIAKADSTTSLASVEAPLQRLEDTLARFVKAHEDIMAVTGSAEADFQRIEFDDGMRVYQDARTRFDDLIARIRSKPPTSAAANSVAQAVSGSTAMRASAGAAEIAKQPGGVGNGNQFAHNAAVATMRCCERAMSSTEDEAGLHHDLLAAYWASYTAAVFGNGEELGDDFREVELAYMRAKHHLTTIIEARRQPAAVRQAANVSTDVKLPRIEIPKFSGNYQAWTTFYDLFSSMVHNAAHRNNVQKMHYLRSCISGEAEHLIRSYKVTEVNYDSAWNALKARYNNKRLIINSHLAAIIAMPASNEESPGMLRRQLDTIAEAVRALSALDMPTQHWDVLLVFILSDKVDADTKRAWEMSLANDELPTFDQLCSFLERRCRSLEAAGTQSSSATNIKGNRSSGGGDARQIGSSKMATQSSNKQPYCAFATTTSQRDSQCAVCNCSHATGSCPEFIRLNAGDRYRKAREANMCFNCLRTDHQTASCKSGSCRKCNGRHHTLLHYDTPPPTSTAMTASVETLAIF